MYTYKYPHPAVTTDCVVFGFEGNSLSLLLIKRGIELDYEEAYGEAEEVKASHRQEIDVKKFAEEVARALKPEMEKLMAECEARVAATETPAPPTPALASMHDAPKDNMASVTDDEVIIPSQTFNFLKGLNDD